MRAATPKPARLAAGQAGPKANLRDFLEADKKARRPHYLSALLHSSNLITFANVGGLLFLGRSLDTLL